MKLSWAKALVAGTFSVWLLCLPTISGVSASPNHNEVPKSLSEITIDYPLEGSVFPPEITAPTFLWRDTNSSAKRWVVEVTFGDQKVAIRVEVVGTFMSMGEIDMKAGIGNDLVQLTPQQLSTRVWQPDAELWGKIKEHSVKKPATITVTGFADDEREQAASYGRVVISTSADPVGAPVFYRDVPLLLSTTDEKGAIAPLPPFALPLIKWKIRDIGQMQSKTVMENLPTCGNCHSFSADGKTLGLDLDGPKNDKGLYAMAPVSSHMTIRNQDVIRWSSFQDKPPSDSSEPAPKRFGFMSQISPDGHYVVTSIAPPNLAITNKDELKEFVPGLADRLFSINYKDVPFAQVFYPTRGILAYYDRLEKKLLPLPGADDPKYVHTSAFWSPDGKYLIFSRAEARDPYPKGQPKPEYANDPRETQIQYDLYKIPFNEGRGGVAEPVEGASHNGFSNNFPKVTPDGKWIVFVQNRNGLLMRPDSKLYIVPFTGGKARLMNCNTSRMNSWHTFSPNGHWMAFSSKARTPYTQLMLTHIDKNGNDTPAIMVENATLANRAVNIPEFVNIPADGLQHIEPEATKFYRLFNQAFDLMEGNKMLEAIPVLREAIAMDPDDALVHYVLATALSSSNQEPAASEEYRKACTLNPRNAPWMAHLATSHALNGDFAGAVESWEKALTINPKDFGAEMDLGTALFQMGQVEAAMEHLNKAIALAPDFAEAHSRLGAVQAKTGAFALAAVELQTAVRLNPESAEYRVNLAYTQAMQGDFASTATSLEKAVELSQGKDWRCLDMLANAYFKLGRSADAVRVEQQALEVAIARQDSKLESTLRRNLEQYAENANGK
jgi:Flp pilus assembly protein TadD